MRTHHRNIIASAVVAAALSSGGIVLGASEDKTPVPQVPNVDLQRYMGPWHIIGAIGLGLEDGAHNAVETYSLNEDGSIKTVFRFAEDRFDGPLEVKNTTAWVEEGTNNAEWRVRTFWPLKQQYVISHLEPDYSAAIIARDKRDYVWILSRNPKMNDEQFERYKTKIADMGYDMSKFSRYPQDGRAPQESAKGGDEPT
jgi:apolipoprotein D and lipocalin family protein